MSDPCPLLWKPDLTPKGAAAVPWLWRGYLARGSMTLLTGQWKAGKTTLLSVLLARLGAGGMLAGQSVAPGRAVIVSEEAPELWGQRGELLDFGQHVCWLCRPFASKPTVAEWEGLIDRLLCLRAEHGLTLAVIDPLAAFLPGRDENSAAAVLSALLPLRRLTAAGMAVQLMHHPRKSGGPDGVLSRGSGVPSSLFGPAFILQDASSGVLGSHADILIEMSYPPDSSPEERRRRLRAFSRFSETPPDHVIELNAAGTDYLSHGSAAKELLARNWPGLQTVLTMTRRKLTRPEILEAWPPEQERPSSQTLWRWLERAVSDGRMKRDGHGTSDDPYRYWLPGQIEVWIRDPLGLLNDPQPT